MGGHFTPKRYGVGELLLFSVFTYKFVMFITELHYFTFGPAVGKLELDFFITLGIALVVIGVIVIISTLILASSRRSEKDKAEVAGIVMIGPIPIIFGTDKKSIKEVLALAFAVTVALIIATVLYYLLLR
jgi:uncharacterized protein (TIGR00304 family)